MSPEAQRIAIAEACGWVGTPDQYYKGGIGWMHVTRGRGKWATHELPDYLNDLNACHEMEKALTTEMQCAAFALCLAHLVKGFPHEPFEGVQSFIWHATAAQRCEAFLRTLGLWVDEKPEKLLAPDP